MRSLAVLAATAAVFSSAPAHAGFTQFGSAAAFDAAVTGGFLETFSGATEDRGLAMAPATLGDMSIVATSPSGLGGFFIGDNKIDVAPYESPLPAWDGTHLNLHTASPFGNAGRETAIEFTFAQPIYAFGADYRHLFANDYLKVEVDGVVIDIGDLGARGFWGFTSTTSFSKIVMTSSTVGQSAVGQIDNVRYASGLASAVPEPSAWAMMIVGFGLAGAAVRRRRAGGLAGAC